MFEVLAEVVSQEDVSSCFALLGDANMKWAAALSAAGCELIYVRHEHCAVAAAMSWARKTNKVGLATVTCGPGVTQILTALPAAVRANIPLVIFAGEAPLKSTWYNQQIDQKPFVEACGAIYQPLHSIDNMPQQVRNGFLRAQREQRPVVLGVPLDLQNERCLTDPVLPPPSTQLLPYLSPVTPNPQELSAAVERINNAARIIVVAGRGVVSADAEDSCQALADQLGALLATTLPARGLFCEHHFNLGIAGGFSTEIAREYFAKADLVIAVGCRLASHTSDAGKLFSSGAVLHIDTEPRVFSQGRIAADSFVRSDARLGTEALLSMLSERRHNNDQWRTSELTHRLQVEPADSMVFDCEPGLLDPRDVVAALDQQLPQDWETVNSSGHCSYYFAQMRRRPANRFLTIREFGAIGNGISFAMGVATAHPDRTVVLFDGDGSLLMHIQELETIRRHNMNILICVMNDGAYGSEIHKLRADGLSDEGAVFGRPSFADIANGFGLAGVVIHELDQITAAMAQFQQNPGAAIWDFHVSDRVVSPVVRRAHP